MHHDLERFVTVHDSGAYTDAVGELRGGRKTGHWIWFIFPQLDGLGLSSTAHHYSLSDLSEVRAYLAHPVLGPRLLECVDLVLATSTPTAEELMGGMDAVKLRSSMTLFLRAGGDAPFQAVLDRFFGGATDDLTDALLARLV